MIDNSLYKNGTVIAVWVKGDNRKETLENYWSFWNHGATQAADLNWTNENEGYFWTNQKKLKRYFKNSSRAIILNELSEDWKGDATSGPKVGGRIADLTEKRFNELWNTQGPSPLYKTPYNPHALGTIEAERGSGNFDDYLTKILQKA
jgi:hypothetical protein